MATTEESGKVNAALTTGIIGTALSGLQMLGNGNGLFGGVFGNNANNAMYSAGMIYTDQLQAQIAELKAEKYADRVGIEVYKAAAERDVRIGKRFEELAREIADMRVREAHMQGNISQVASNATNGINCLRHALDGLQYTVNNITRTVVPRTVVCPEPMPRYNSWTEPAAPTATEPAPAA